MTYEQTPHRVWREGGVVIYHHRTYHFPTWVVIRDQHEALAQEAARNEAVNHYLETSKQSKSQTAEYAVTNLNVMTGLHRGRDQWCWRHLSRCQVVELGWHLVRQTEPK